MGEVRDIRIPAQAANPSFCPAHAGKIFIYDTLHNTDFVVK
jgi:hypothetical protein